ncbi:MAG TPA: hypothetical protein VGB54_06400 [Allosphingosinicella sp.]|jgi:hypothetical protein
MRIIQMGLVMAMTLVVGVSSSAATAPVEALVQVQRRAWPGPLLPLSERDLTSTRQMGCTCTFEARNRSLVQAIGNELMVRTRAGRQVCRISDSQFQRMSGASGTYACGGVRLSLRRTGRSRSHMASDSVTMPATLSARQGRTNRSLAGTWGCAC